MIADQRNTSLILKVRKNQKTRSSNHFSVHNHNFLGTERWMKCLNRTIVNDWNYWYLNQDIAGAQVSLYMPLWLAKCINCLHTITYTAACDRTTKFEQTSTYSHLSFILCVRTHQHIFQVGLWWYVSHYGKGMWTHDTNLLPRSWICYLGKLFTIEGWLCSRSSHIEINEKLKIKEWVSWHAWRRAYYRV